MIILEKFTEADFEQLIGWINTPQLLTDWAGGLFSFPLTDRSLKWYIEDSNMDGTSDAFIFKAIDGNTGNVVGHISLGNCSYKNNSTRITRVFISKEMQGRGYCRQMIVAILKIAFEELKFHRVSLGVYTDNKAAIKCYETAGMKSEGINRDILKTSTGYRSMLEMSLLDYEWKEIARP